MARSVSGRRRGAARLPPMGQGLAVAAVLVAVACLTIVGIGGYMLSLRIAAARAEVARLDELTLARRADVLRLRRDYEIRSRLGELDRWRLPLDLAPATSAQFVANGAGLPVAAERRREALRAEAEEAQAGQAPARPGYSQAARRRLDDLIDAVSAAPVQ